MYNSGINKKSALVTNFWPKVMYDMPLHSRVCCLEIITNLGLSKGIRFIRSAGSRGLLLDNKYRDSFSIIVLPSFKIKIINSRSVAFLNYIENELFKYLRVKKAGHYVNKGKKPTVRGIVKNTCDHPNGGRTRTILLSRTPWGKVAKKSRKRSDVINLKTLSKRILSRSNKKNLNNPDSVRIVNIFQDTSTIKYISKVVTDHLSTAKL